MKTKNLLILTAGIIAGILAFQKREKIKQVINRILGNNIEIDLADLTISLPEEQKPKKNDPIGTEYELLRDYSAGNTDPDTGNTIYQDLTEKDIITKLSSTLLNNKTAIITNEGYVIPIIIIKKITK